MPRLPIPDRVIVSRRSPQGHGQMSMLHFLGDHYLHKVHRILHRRIAHLPHLFVLCSNLFISIWTHSCLSFTLGYNPTLFCCSNSSSVDMFWACWACFSWFLCHLDISIIIFLTLLSGTMSCILSCMLPACPSISHFSRRLCSSFWKMVLEIKIRMQPIATG